MDECEGKHQSDMLQFLRDLSAPLEKRPLVFKVLGASRPENVVESRFGSSPSLKVQDYSQEDIKNFVTKSFEDALGDLHPMDLHSSGAVALSRPSSRKLREFSSGPNWLPPSSS